MSHITFKLQTSESSNFKKDGGRTGLVIQGSMVKPVNMHWILCSPRR
jgi:hypothetical protein